MDFDREIVRNLSRRLGILYFSIIIVFIIIFLRLWDLQILKGDYFFDLSENNRIKIREIIAPRGIVFDRNGNILADNSPSFDISLLHQGIKTLDEIVPLLSKILNMDSKNIVGRVTGSSPLPRFKPIKIKLDVSREELSLVEFFKLDLPNIVIEVFPKRNYPLGKGGAHLVGYLGEIDGAELKIPGYADYNPGDFIGKSGIEKIFECQLRGRSGWSRFEVDALGRKKRVLGCVDPAPGKNLCLTIDLDLQRFVDKVLGKKVGAVIAMSPKDGEILAFVSHPAYDPNLFSRGISSRDWHKLTKDSRHPLNNRCIQGLYPPGSVFKIITAIAGLEEGKITPETSFFCNGSYRFGNRSYRCWEKGGHGRLNLYEALERSCDIYFYQAGLRIGIDSLAYYARAFGLGEPTGFIFNNEKEGLVPTKRWKEKTFKTPWQEGETLSSAIGQSFVLVTPLQVLVLISAIANNGKICVPRLVKRIESAAGEAIKEFPPVCASRAPVSAKSIAAVREALRRVVQNPCGTGKIARIEGLELAGKTGTAQVVSSRVCEKTLEVPFYLRDHAWFVAFAPFQDPKISVVVLVEHGGFGSSVAGPIIKEIIDYYLNKMIRLENIEDNG